MPTNLAVQDRTILVVDDTPTNLQVLFDLLSEQNYRILIAKSGEVALQRLQTSKPSLILLDVMMPGIDGFETCQQIKANPATCETPIIFMTALSDAVDKVKGLNLGAVDYITKPIQHEEVLARIRIHLQLRQTTQILAQRTEELHQALAHLQQTQAHLVQSEKMSALGQLVAGIAHEINNPINFIHGNLEPAQEYVRALLSFVELYRDCYPQPHPKLQAWMEAMDLEYLETDLSKLMTSIQLGSDRIQDLVVSLRNFSRLDESDFKTVDIHEGINSTLLILQHRLKPWPDHPGIQIIREYGSLPLVGCYPGHLNQVFMNLLSNAIDALEEQGNWVVPQPTIAIRTSVTPDDWVRIAIADNAGGMDATICNRIFDPFFTTKPIGKGTGLGLSISYQIVTETHHGRLDFHSTPGQGTEFCIDLPLVATC